MRQKDGHFEIRPKDIFCRTAPHELSFDSMYERADDKQIGIKASRVSKQSDANV